jgi:Tfp pilus assembly protein PilF
MASENCKATSQKPSPIATATLRSAMASERLPCSSRARAIADLNVAVAIDPKSADLVHQRGIVFQAKGEKTKAQRDFDQATKLGWR